MSGIASVWAAGSCPMPVVQTFHALGRVKRRYQAGTDTSPPQRVGIEAIVAQRASAIIATCTDEIRELTAYGARPDTMYVVPCGVDCDHFRPGPQAGRPRSPARVLTLGRLVPRKGIDTVISAIARIPGAELVVAGGPDRSQLDDDPEVSRLRRTAAECGVTDLLSSADVVVSDPGYEPFGIVSVEAMACGSAVIASAVGGHLDTVADGVTGLLVPPRDPAALAGRLSRLLADPGWRRELGAAGAVRARARYSWDRIAAETEAVYACLRQDRIVSAR